jgi:tetratricopeptide (TPR) repeat protein
MEPLYFSIPVHRFDLNLLPPDARKIGSEAFTNAVILHFVEECGSRGQNAIVSVDSENINVHTFQSDADPLAFVIGMLQSGRIKEALPFLESLVAIRKDDVEVLYNLGIAYSELGRYEDAVMRLKKATGLDPNHSNAWTGIGVAYIRLKRHTDAKTALDKAIAADPGNGYAHRNLGGLLCLQGEFTAALPHMREAHNQLPDDPQAIYGLAQCLDELGNQEEADPLFLEIIKRFPAAPVAELAREARTKLAQKNLRANVPGGFRPDVMMYIMGALDTFDKIGSRKRQEVALEIALLGQRGLDINDPEQKYSLKTLPGKYSGLHLLAFMYTAFKQIDPTLDSGADFSQEYEMAMQSRKKSG